MEKFRRLNNKNMRLFLIILLLLIQNVVTSQVQSDTACNCNQNPLWLGRWLNFDQKQISILPIAHPVIYVPSINLSKKVESDSGQFDLLENTDFLAGADLVLYSPYSLLNFGSQFVFYNRSFTFTDTNLHIFYII